ncbi:MAG TPA: hybrid sensor histidine kinase/response regulator, partial [Xanthobacteraceae bacterium]|nr:hybrid sensor histidine kinase/response regulator [Xanthobacteraceae bacterium]
MTGILAYRNLLGIAVPRSLERLDQHVRLLASELEAVVRGARADVLAFAVDEMVIGSSGDLADRSNIFAATERRRLESRFSAELTAKPWYDELRIIGIADGGREIIRVDRSGAGGAIRAMPDSELQRDGDRDYFQKTMTLAAGDVYISPIELETTRGVIDTPRVPTMRVAAPLFAPDGRRFGIVIANLDLRPV